MSSSAQGQRTVVDILQEFSIPLIAGVLSAVVLANVAPHAYHVAMDAHLLGSWFPLGENHPISFHFLMNDIFMVFFFGIAAKEITESVLPGGSLNPVSKAINPLLGTLGGIFGPIGAFFIYVAMTGANEIANGWAIPTATDIALAWLVARLVFGHGHPAISFLLLLAVADDAIGLGIIAVFYPDPTNPVKPIMLLLVIAGMATAFGLRKFGVKNFWYYIIGPGVLAWLGLILAHLHPALALVFIVPFMPTSDHDAGMFQEEVDEHDTLNEFEHKLKLPVDFGLFGFGLANAGVALSDMGHATWAVLCGLIIGKTVGIFGLSYIGHLLGFRLPDGMDWRSLLVAGTVAALGLTVALFVSGVAYTDAGLIGSAKMGALLSVLVVPIALVLGAILGVKKKQPAKADSSKAVASA